MPLSGGHRPGEAEVILRGTDRTQIQCLAFGLKFRVIKLLFSFAQNHIPLRNPSVLDHSALISIRKIRDL